ncbi:ATPase [Polyrhizophydium stewartii]|uniref:ATPase n=1 Tax=Polyrhizophydium stewartii TaxID=2732419 RepID=A0ABR4NJT0_9FUNG
MSAAAATLPGTHIPDGVAEQLQRSRAASGPARTPQQRPAQSVGPAAVYEQLVSEGRLREDAHQRKTVGVLQALFDELANYSPPVLPPPKVEKRKAMADVGSDAGRDRIKSPDFAWIEENEKTVFGMFKSLFDRRESGDAELLGPRGLYLFGDVGTGKTMIMDLFYKTIDIQRKRRVHFHAFMQDTHKRIHQLRVHEGITSDPIPLIASELASEAWLLCFDELQVTDITDAMILRRLFSELFKRGVVMVTTSNRHPDDLYQNGIQRKSFLPAIDLLKERCKVHSLNSGIDYRKQDHQRVDTYLWPLNIETDDVMRRLFNEIRGKTPSQPKELSFWGRTMTIREAAGRVAKVPFKQLCGEPHSAADYLELVKHFDVLILTDVPAMTVAHRNEARRFITLIDALYENKIKLVASFEVPLFELFSGEPHDAEVGTIDDSHRMLMDDLKLSAENLTSTIFTGAEEVFAFQRAVSRLVEMQTHGWVGSALERALAKLQQPLAAQAPHSAAAGGAAALPNGAKKTRRRKKRSPNRDDSDSDDDDDDDDSAGAKPKKRAEDDDDALDDGPDPEDDPNYTPFDCDEAIRAGFKVGFSEDRNKKYRRTMENFAQLLKEQPDTPVPELLNNAFLLTDKQLSQRKGMHSGCTAVVAFVRSEMRPDAGNPSAPPRKQRVLYTANVGDSRAVLCRDGTAARLSYDHKGSDQQEARRIIEAGGFVMNNRVNGVLAVTRSLGDTSLKEWVIGNPYTTETVLGDKDAFLVLACDGIWDVCSDQQGCDIIKDIRDPQEAADTLLDYALDNYSTDNLTVVVSRFNPKFLE